MLKFERDGKAIFVSFLIEKVWTSPNSLNVSPERSNKITDQISLSPERRLRRH